ncbi:MAG: SphA family protein, partial [Gammaproteobacteria bacterium]
VITEFLWVLVLAGMLTGSNQEATAGELGHYQPGMLNIRDFFVPEPGFYASLYAFKYAADELKNRNGNDVGPLGFTGPLGTTTLAVDPDIDVNAIAPMFIWVSPWKILGAKYTVAVSPSFADSNLNASLKLAREGVFINSTVNRSLSVDTGWGVGDLFVEPVLLGWGGKHYDATAGYGFYAPVGEEGISLEFWTHQFLGAAAWYPFDNRGTAVAIAGVYEIHSQREDSDITPGDRFTLNWGVSQYLPLNNEQTWLAELGVTGYSQWQVEKDSGSDVPRIGNFTLNAKDEIHAAGFQLGLTYVPFKTAYTFRYLKEFGAEGRFEGDYFGLSLAKGF